MRDIEAKASAIIMRGRALALYVSPRFEYLPIEAQRYDEPLLPYARLILEGAAEVLGAVVFDLSAYLQYGGIGTVALERSIRLFNESTLTVVDGPFTDPAFKVLLDDLSFAPDAITVTGEAWTTSVPNTRLIRTTRVGFRNVDRTDLMVGDVTFQLAGAAILEQSRSIDFRSSLREAAADLLNRPRRG